MFTSKYTVPQDVDSRISKLPLQTTAVSSYIEFLKEYNVVALNTIAEIDYCIECAGELLPLEVLFGFSEVDAEDLLYVNDMYEYRIPENYCAVASMNYGDLLCLSPTGKVYHWDHEVNDLYLDMTVKDGYLEQNNDLAFVADSFGEFLAMITRTEVKDDETA